VKHLDLENQLRWCNTFKITPNELILFEILLLLQENDDTELVKSYFELSEESRGSFRESLLKLQKAGLVNQSYKIPEKGTVINPYDIPLNKVKTKQFYKNSFELGKDLYENYPLSTIVNGVEYKLRRVSKKFNSLEDAYLKYGKAIGWNPVKHEEIIALIKQGVESNYNFTTLDDFIVDNDWLNLAAISKDGIINNSNMKLL
jgi:hypothetical protein